LASMGQEQAKEATEDAAETAEPPQANEQPVAETPATATSTSTSSEPELIVDNVADLETLDPGGVVTKLNEAVTVNPQMNHFTIEACCKRVRVLCREVEQCKECDAHGAALAVVSAMRALPAEMTVQLQGLAAIVNLCSGEANDHRAKAVDAGALEVIVAAMTTLCTNAEVQEMGCIALQNCCYGEDSEAPQRRKRAAEDGAIKAVLAAMNSHQAIPAAQEVGIATLKLIVHKVPELRKQAVAEGAKFLGTKESGGVLSFRLASLGGLGTKRRFFNKKGGGDN